MRFTPKTVLPLEDLKTQALLDTLEELCNVHESVMLSTTRVFLEQQIVLVHAELDAREATEESWGIKR